MFIKKSRHKFADGSIKTQITLAETFRPGKGLPPKTRTLKNYGYLEDQPDQEKFMRDLETLVEQSRKSRQQFELRIDTDRLINNPSNRDLNYGVLVIKKLYEQLRIPEFIRVHRKSKAKYDLNAILCYLTCMKIIFPDSKRATYMDSKHVYGMDIRFDLQDVYAALTEICDLRFELQHHLQKEVQRLLKADKSYVYLDVTNTYMEMDFAREDTLPQRGVSKDHKTEPIIQMGLLLDSNGMPLLHECFPGNTSDTLVLQPMIEQVRKSGMTAGRIIVVADKGLNSGKNIDYLCNNGNGYVFSQILKGKKGSRYHARMFDETRYTYNSDGSYKWQLFEESFIGLDQDGKKVQRKRKVLIYWSAAQAKAAKMKREEKVRRAKKALSNNAYTIDHSKYKYIKAEKVDGTTGEILDNINDMLSIDAEKIDEEARFDGYFCIITSEMDYDEQRIREVYHNLWLIENTFRLEKTDQEMRAVYVWTDDHIRAHFMIGHLAALITRLIQYSMQKEAISAERIKRVLTKCVLDIPVNGVVHLHDISGNIQFCSFVDAAGEKCYNLIETGKDEVFEDFVVLSRALNFSLKKAYMRQEDFNNLLASLSLSLQH